MKDLKKEALEYHQYPKPGKLAVIPTKPCQKAEDLSLAYTPGVAQPCLEIEKNPRLAYTYTNKGNLIAVISNGTAVLGLGDIGPLAGKPVMEGKAVLFKRFAGLDAFDLEINEKDPKKFIEIVASLEPSFGGINLEDIKGPECFQIEEELIRKMKIPLMHDDQHGTAVVVLAALVNALKVVGKNFEDITVVVSGAGAAGTAITKMLVCGGISTKVCIPVKDVLLCDSHGIIHKKRTDLNGSKKELVKITNKSGKTGTFADAFKGADVFIGVSAPNIVTSDMIKSMAQHAIVFAMANPDPEITYEEAVKAGAAVVGTGRSDYPNQINNSLAFPGVFAGALRGRATKITLNMKIAASDELASSIVPTRDEILPSMFLPGLAGRIAKRVAHQAQIDNVIRY